MDEANHEMEGIDFISQGNVKTPTFQCLIGGFNPLETWWSSSVGMMKFPTEWTVIEFHGSSHHQPDVVSVGTAKTRKSYLKHIKIISETNWRTSVLETSDVFICRVQMEFIKSLPSTSNVNEDLLSGWCRWRPEIDRVSWMKWNHLLFICEPLESNPQ